MGKCVVVVLALLLCGGIVGSAAADSVPPPAVVQTAANPAPELASPAPAQERGMFAVLVVAAIFAATAFSLLTIRKSLLHSSWSLSDALSEDVEMTVDNLPAAGAPVAAAGAAPIAPAKVTKLVASTSRFIAMLGLVAILMMFIGFGMVILYDFALTGKPPADGSLTPLIYFLTSGMTLFAPYLVNKVAAVMS